MTGSTLALFARFLLSLGVVIGLMWAAATVLRKRGVGTGGGRHPRGGLHVDVLARRPLGRNTSIAVVRVGERSMIVGVTEQHISKLDDIDIDEIALDEGTNWTVSTGRAAGPASAWKTMLEQMRNRTVRR